MRVRGLMPPCWPAPQVILLSDGSVTRHLQLMTNQRVEVRPARLLRAAVANPPCVLQLQTASRAAHA